MSETVISRFGVHSSGRFRHSRSDAAGAANRNLVTLNLSNGFDQRQGAIRTYND